jgi:two-component system sensor histidine kinase HupT/HoxJ
VTDFRDNGPGVEAENLAKIFDPFFTTKPVGKGTGLGLAISYGIVERHGGRLEVANHADGGAVFTLSLPLAKP